ncbi:unnamed protein product, partial [Symbiodinium pilosum]
MGVNVPFQWTPALLGDIAAAGKVTGTVRVPDTGWPRVQKAIASWVDRFNVQRDDFRVDKPGEVYSDVVPGGREAFVYVMFVPHDAASWVLAREEVENNAVR